MDTVGPESMLAKRKRVMMMIIRKLVEGQEAATELKLLLQKPFGKNNNNNTVEEEAEEKGSLSSSVDELVANVLRSFTDSLSVLTSSEQGCGGRYELGQNLQNSSEIGSPAVKYSGNDPYTEDCRNRSSQPPSKKHVGRGCYKRRRNAQSWTKVSPTVDDDHAWRKYGQKDILNSNFPRSYFRCSRKYEQGCRATKQVQRMQDYPEMYLTTYIGFHTCKGNHSHPDDDSNNKVKEQDHPIIPSSDEITEHKILDPTIWSDLKDFDHNNNNNGDTSVHYSSVHFGTHDHHFHFDDHSAMSCFDVNY